MAQWLLLSAYLHCHNVCRLGCPTASITHCLAVKLVLGDVSIDIECSAAENERSR
jgi:hypothetical protein